MLPQRRLQIMTRGIRELLKISVRASKLRSDTLA
jgi:hypothetical protein